jgi:hypothetical protein
VLSGGCASLAPAIAGLPKCAGDHLETEKEQNEEKYAPAEACHHGGGRLFIHFKLFLNLLDFLNSYFIKVAGIGIERATFLVRRGQECQGKSLGFLSDFSTEDQICPRNDHRSPITDQ